MLEGRLRNVPVRGPSANKENAEPVDVFIQFLNTAFCITPVALLSLLVLVFAYSVTLTPHDLKRTSRVSMEASATKGQQTNVHLGRPPTLQVLLADIADALDNAGVTYWLLPGLGLLPPSSAGAKLDADGRVSPWQEGVDIGIFQADLMRVIRAQAELQERGIVPVESYFGLRVFPITGRADDRYDFRTPFVDILYFKEDNGHAINFCCDCAPITVSACTKKTCGCLVCAATLHEIFPLSSVHIEGMRRGMPGPKNKESLVLPRDLDGVHPAVFDI